MGRSLFQCCYPGCVSQPNMRDLVEPYIISSSGFKFTTNNSYKDPNVNAVPQSCPSSPASPFQNREGSQKKRSSMKKLKEITTNRVKSNSFSLITSDSAPQLPTPTPASPKVNFGNDVESNSKVNFDNSVNVELLDNSNDYTYNNNNNVDYHHQPQHHHYHQQPFEKNSPPQPQRHQRSVSSHSLTSLEKLSTTLPSSFESTPGLNEGLQTLQKQQRNRRRSRSTNTSLSTDSNIAPPRSIVHSNSSGNINMIHRRRESGSGNEYYNTADFTTEDQSYNSGSVSDDGGYGVSNRKPKSRRSSWSGQHQLNGGEQKSSFHSSGGRSFNSRRSARGSSGAVGHIRKFSKDGNVIVSCNPNTTRKQSVSDAEINSISFNLNNIRIDSPAPVTPTSTHYNYNNNTNTTHSNDYNNIYNNNNSNNISNNNNNNNNHVYGYHDDYDDSDKSECENYNINNNNNNTQRFGYANSMGMANNNTSNNIIINSKPINTAVSDDF
eukprot:Pgem_evm1s16292